MRQSTVRNNNITKRARLICIHCEEPTNHLKRILQTISLTFRLSTLLINCYS